MRPASSVLCFLQKLAVDEHSGTLHAVQHRDQRLFDRFIEILQSRQCFELRPERLMQLKRHVRVFGGVLGGAIDVDLIEGDLLRALSADIFVVNGLDAEVFFDRRIHVMPGRRRC